MATQADPKTTAGVQLIARRKTASGRHGFVDALRGFSLLGILLVNIEYIVQPSEIGWENYQSTTDQVVRWLVVAFGQTKVYPLFALLFGYGLALQLRRADTAGVGLWPRYRRRLIGLAVLGVLHGVLFFPGDILLLYSIVGAVAFRFRRTESKQLLRLGAKVYAAASFIWLVIGALEAAGMFGGGTSTVSSESLRVFGTGSFAELVELQFFYWIAVFAILVAIQGPAVFASFVVGIALGRTTLLADPAAHRPIAIRALRWMPLGLAGAALGASLTIVGGQWSTLGFAIGFASAPLLAAGYLAGLALLLQQAPRLSRLLQASGRMSLTVYLLESVLAAWLSYGYGWGRFTEIGPLAGVGWAVTIWLALSIAAVLWMRVAKFGPFEWLLRSFTYQKRQALLR